MKSIDNNDVWIDVLCLLQLVISFDEITDLEKRMTAKIIPNGITITTDTSKVMNSKIAYSRCVELNNDGSFL